MKTGLLNMILKDRVVVVQYLECSCCYLRSSLHCFVSTVFVPSLLSLFGARQYSQISHFIDTFVGEHVC